MQVQLLTQWLHSLDGILLGPTTTVFLALSLVLLLYTNRAKRGEEAEDGNQDEE